MVDKHARNVFHSFFVSLITRTSSDQIPSIEETGQISGSIDDDYFNTMVYHRESVAVDRKGENSYSTNVDVDLDRINGIDKS